MNMGELGLGGQNVTQHSNELNTIVCHKHRLIYFVTARVASRSIRRALSDEELSIFCFKLHGGIFLDRKTQQRIPDYFENYTKIGFVRNPWDRLVSAYHFIVTQEELRYNFFGSKSTEFRIFCQNVLRQPQSKIICYVRPQCLLLPNKDSVGFELDFLGRFERLDDDWGILKKQFGLPRLTHLRKTIRKHYSKYYDDRTRDQILNYYRLDIQNFGYGFNVN
jgi:hypothetical protein